MFFSSAEFLFFYVKDILDDHAPNLKRNHSSHSMPLTVNEPSAAVAAKDGKKTRRKISYTDLFSSGDASFRNDNDLVFFADRHHLGHTVGVTAVVDVSCRSAAHRRVDHLIVVYTEHIRPAVLYKIRDNV